MMANVITGLRILVSAVLVFCPVFSQIFYVLYLIAGLSDMVDGIIARKTNSVSEFGSRLLNDPPNLEGHICKLPIRRGVVGGDEIVGFFAEDGIFIFVSNMPV